MISRSSMVGVGSAGQVVPSSPLSPSEFNLSFSNLLSPLRLPTKSLIFELEMLADTITLPPPKDVTLLVQQPALPDPMIQPLEVEI